MNDDPNKCSACPNPYHPATGHRWSERTRLCGACALHWMRWLRAATRPPARRALYEAGAKGRTNG